MIALQASPTKQQIEQMVYQEYDFYPTHIEQHGKVRKIECTRGIYALKQTAVNASQMTLLNCLFRYLRQQHYTSFLALEPSKYGDPFIDLEGSCYYVNRWVYDRTEEKYREDWPQRVLRQLGHLHRLTLAYEEPAPVSPLTPEIIGRRWKNRLEKMQAYRQLALGKPFMSPFEIAYVSHFEYLKELARQAMRYLQAWEEKLNKKQEQRAVICHGNVHRQHVLHEDDRLYFIHFDHAVLDSPVRELALFYRRHLEPTAHWDVETGFKWLEDYEEQFVLHGEEKLLLGIYLLFPERVFKEVEKYYEAKHHAHPFALARQFEQQIELTRIIRRFVREIIQTDLKIT